jgi:hydrogenase maturation protease
MNAVVIGVGNDFRRDDGAGPAVVDLLAALGDAIPSGTRLAVCDGEPTRMIELWEGAELAIVIDAAAGDPESGPCPGAVLRWDVPVDPTDTTVAPPRIRSDSTGTHSLGPGTAISLARILDRLPRRLLVFAVVGTEYRIGPGLSDPVAAAVARLTPEVVAELAGQGLSAC